MSVWVQTSECECGHVGGCEWTNIILRPHSPSHRGTAVSQLQCCLKEGLPPPHTHTPRVLEMELYLWKWALLWNIRNILSMKWSRPVWEEITFNLALSSSVNPEDIFLPFALFLVQEWPKAKCPWLKDKRRRSPFQVKNPAQRTWSETESWDQRLEVFDNFGLNRRKDYLMVNDSINNYWLSAWPVPGARLALRLLTALHKGRAKKLLANLQSVFAPSWTHCSFLWSPQPGITLQVHTNFGQQSSPSSHP